MCNAMASPLSRTPKAGHIKAGRSDVDFGGFDLAGWSLCASSDAHSALQNKGCRLLARNCSDRASESLGQKNSPRRDMRRTGFIVTGFRCSPNGWGIACAMFGVIAGLSVILHTSCTDPCCKNRNFTDMFYPAII